jgi:PAS domain S-box-containing protein
VQQPDPDQPSALPAEFLLDLFMALPVLVVRLDSNGLVLAANPATERITGYTQQELLHQNWWAKLFPGRLFAQVPQFVSLTLPGPMRQDFPMALRTKAGTQRVVAFSRFHREAANEMICVGIDLTDRLNDADRTAPSPETHAPTAPDAAILEGAVVDPVAVLPAAAGTGSSDMALVNEVDECTGYMDAQIGHMLFDAQVAAAALVAALAKGPHAGDAVADVARTANALQQRHTEQLAELARHANELGDLARRSPKSA